MRMRTCVSVVVCVARKLRPCPSYSGRRDRNNSVHWRSLYKGGGTMLRPASFCLRHGERSTNRFLCCHCAWAFIAYVDMVESMSEFVGDLMVLLCGPHNWQI